MENVLQKVENRSKHKSKKGNKNEDSNMEIHETLNTDGNVVVENVPRSEIEDNAEMKKPHKRDKEKKNEKGKKDIEVDMVKKGASKVKASDVSCEDGGADAVNKAEWKRKKRKFEIGSSEEVGSIEGRENMEEESVQEIKKKRKKSKDGDFEKEREQEHVKEGGKFEANVTEKIERKKRKRDKKKSKDDDCVGSKDDASAGNSTVDNENKSEQIADEPNDEFVKKSERKKTKKNKSNDPKSSTQDSIDNDSNTKAENPHKEKKKKPKKSTKNRPDDPTPTPSKSNKKVRFSDQNEVFPLLPADPNTTNDDEHPLVRGKRFTIEENELVKQAVHNYILDHDLGEEGLNMVLNSSKHPKLRGCWREIATALPHRPHTAVYCRAQVIFRRSEDRKWTQEEYDMILKYQELHGNEWKALADELGKHRWHVKDTFRRIKLLNRNKGNWSQKEYQGLFDLVNTDLQLKISEEKKSKHGMLRDNICWTAISDKLETRNLASCCIKWYNQLTSPMVSEGLWADTDDYRLIGTLYELDASCVEDVDWDDLIEHRSGDVCLKRWKQMVLHIGHYGNKTFGEQVDALAKRYCPNLLEAREIWDNKPRVP